MRTRNRSLSASTAAALALTLLAAACAKREAAPSSAEAPAPAAVDSPTLGLRLSALPAGFSDAREIGSGLQIHADLEGTQGLAILRVLQGQGSINLVEEAKGYGAAAEAAGGKFFGGNELVTPTGPAYAARILADQGTAEEQRVFLLHPDGSERLLTVTLRYPPAAPETTRARMQQLLELVAAVEPLPASG
jgi:hypothetical protein